MSYDDNTLAVLGQLPEDPREGAKQLNDVPRLRTVHDLLSGAMQRAFAPDTTRRICSTGNHRIDEMTGGFLPGWCWMIAASTNLGKSTLATAFADVNLRNDRGVLIVSLEDPEELYADRLLLRRARKNERECVSADNLRLGRLTHDERRIITEVAARAERKPMFLDARGRKGEWIAKQLEHILDNHDIDLVIIDYLQEIGSSTSHHTLREQTTAMAREIRGAVKSRKRSVVILSQVTVGEDPDKWPRMNQVRDSRDVVNASEVVLMMGVAKRPIIDKSGRVLVPEGERGVLVEKVKFGRKGFVHLPWCDRAACFIDVPGQYDEFDNEFDAHLAPLPNEPVPPHWTEPTERDEWGMPGGL